jgi:hypothetical protein
VQVESTVQDEEDIESNKQGHWVQSMVQSMVQDEEDDSKNQISVVNVGYYLQA